MDKFFPTCVRLTHEEEPVWTVSRMKCQIQAPPRVVVIICNLFMHSFLFPSCIRFSPHVEPLLTTFHCCFIRSRLKHQNKSTYPCSAYIMQFVHAFLPLPTMSQAVEMLNFSDSKKGAFTEWRLTVPCLGR